MCVRAYSTRHTYLDEYFVMLCIVEWLKKSELGCWGLGVDDISLVKKLWVTNIFFGVGLTTCLITQCI